MSAKRDEAFKQWKNGFIRHYEPLTSVEAFVGGWNSRDAEVAELKAKLAEAERRNGVALEAMKAADAENSILSDQTVEDIKDAIKEMEKP